MFLEEACAALEDEVINYSSLTGNRQVIGHFADLKSAVKSSDCPAFERHYEALDPYDDQVSTSAESRKEALVSEADPGDPLLTGPRP